MIGVRTSVTEATPGLRGRVAQISLGGDRRGDHPECGLTPITIGARAAHGVRVAAERPVQAGLHDHPASMAEQGAGPGASERECLGLLGARRVAKGGLRKGEQAR